MNRRFYIKIPGWRRVSFCGRSGPCPRSLALQNPFIAGMARSYPTNFDALLFPLAEMAVSLAGEFNFI